MRSNSGKEVLVEDWLFPSIPAQFTYSRQYHERKFDRRYSNSIVYSPSLRDHAVDESVDEALICDITSCRKNNDIGIDDRDLLSRLLKLACVDICYSDAFASACCESLCNSSSDSCAIRQSSHPRKDPFQPQVEFA